MSTPGHPTPGPATHSPDDALELFDRALSYTCGALATVTDASLSRATPCTGWSLGDLLAHMDDALDAFAEGAAGFVAVEAHAPAALRVSSLRAKAGALHGLWSTPTPPHVRIGGLAVDTTVLVLVATLEVAVHGWDVAASTGVPRPIAGGLADLLLPVAAALVDDDDRRRRFGPALPVGPGASPSTRLLGYLGRPA